MNVRNYLQQTFLLQIGSIGRRVKKQSKSFPPLFRKSQKLYIEDLEATRDVTKGIEENVIDITIL